jgi:hypothetical protein
MTGKQLSCHSHKKPDWQWEARKLIAYHHLCSCLFAITWDCIRCKTEKRGHAMIKIGTQRSSRITAGFYMWLASSANFELTSDLCNYAANLSTKFCWKLCFFANTWQI